MYRTNFYNLKVREEIFRDRNTTGFQPSDLRDSQFQLRHPLHELLGFAVPAIALDLDSLASSAGIPRYVVKRLPIADLLQRRQNSSASE
jgi:hypothetical protein